MEVSRKLIKENASMSCGKAMSKGRITELRIAAAMIKKSQYIL
jgi:hypothetical protein